MSNAPRITIEPDGPYVVTGLPLREKTPVVSEEGEKLTWRTGATLREADEAPYRLCRCGRSSTKPFCDDSHLDDGFDGAETAPVEPYEARAKALGGATGMELRDARGTCQHAGFCSDRLSNVWKLRHDTDDTLVRARVMRMVENCPSGALTYSVDGEPVERAYAAEVATTPDGPLWVTGGVPVERADGAPMEVRNRVTLCRCGASGNKPLCDGSHADVGFAG